MITVTYKLYNHDYDKKIEKKTFYSMKEVEDWLFEKMTGNLKNAAYIMDPDKKVKDVISDAEKELGTSIKMTGYVRFKLGEGLQKKEEDFAAEVAAQIK